MFLSCARVVEIAPGDSGRVECRPRGTREKLSGGAGFACFAENFLDGQKRGRIAAEFSCTAPNFWN